MAKFFSQETWEAKAGLAAAEGPPEGQDRGRRTHRGHEHFPAASASLGSSDVRTPHLVRTLKRRDNGRGTADGRTGFRGAQSPEHGPKGTLPSGQERQHIPAPFESTFLKANYYPKEWVLASCNERKERGGGPQGKAYILSIKKKCPKG